jgi:hypothetical protein
MATAGAWAARVAQMAISNAAVASIGAATFVNIERVNSPRISGTLDVAESSSNDDAGAKTFVPTWEAGSFTFEMIADDSATGQGHVWSAYTGKEIRAFRCRPRGNSSLDYEMECLGIVTNIEQSNDKSDVSKYSVTVQKTGAWSRTTI